MSMVIVYLLLLIPLSLSADIVANDGYGLHNMETTLMVLIIISQVFIQGVPEKMVHGDF